MAHDSNAGDKPPSHRNIPRGLSRLTLDAVSGVTRLVESLHLTIAGKGKVPGLATVPTEWVYDQIQAITRLVGDSLDLTLGQVGPLLGNWEEKTGSQALISALNGVVGDHLAAGNNPLAIPMQFRRKGRPLNTAAFQRFMNKGGRRLLILVHGSCMNDLQWLGKGHNHGAALARDLGSAPLYLRYNTGRHISENGREFSQLLEDLLCNQKEPASLTILAHSMGGLVSRSACHYAAASGHGWLKHLTNMVFLGTPHHGAPLEKLGNHLERLLEFSPYSAPFARLSKLRSSGITDLRYGYVVDQDWKDKDPQASRDNRRPVPLPNHVACYALAASKSREAGLAGDHLLGDGLVPVDSALGRHPKPQHQLAIPQDHQWLGRNMDHFDLLYHPDVYQILNKFLVPGV